MKNERIEKLFESFTEDIRENMPKVVDLLRLNAEYYLEGCKRTGYFDYLTLFQKACRLDPKEVKEDDLPVINWLKESAESLVRSFQRDLIGSIELYDMKFNKNFFTDAESELMEDLATLEYEARVGDDYKEPYYRYNNFHMSERLLRELHNNRGKAFSNSDLAYFMMDLIDVYRAAFDPEDKNGLVADEILAKLKRID